ncbi:MAG: iron-containing alcohol dehydrogenase [Spirochaetes bacterium]|nr:iron-containing alcohol dehydrogenase [Spirochaetota bacterium]
MEINFTVGKIPHTVFFKGAIATLPAHIQKFGRQILLITGKSSLQHSGKLHKVEAMLKANEIRYDIITVAGEPSPELVDDAVSLYKNSAIDAVVAIGGGSVIDAGKAISAMLPLGHTVVDYLEVVGTKQHSGIKVPFIALPTTAGTGSEATKNAVLSKQGAHGFKRSLRHDNFVPDIAIIDPELMQGCPPSITAASGLDALTQLIESYVSTQANTFTDSLAISGIEKISQSLLPLCVHNEDTVYHRANMAYAAYISGITLAHVGLGVVHGLASPLGALFGIPHGIACGTMLSVCTKATIKKLKDGGDSNYLKKYAVVGNLLTGYTGSIDDTLEKLTSTLENLVEVLHMPRLSQYGVTKQDFPLIIRDGGNKNNPAPLNDKEIFDVLLQRL